NILLIDSYDSFTYNLSDILRQVIPEATVHVIRNDDCTAEQLHSLLPFFHAAVVGPGPGSPDDPAAVGVIPEVWAVCDDLMLPVLGVCLGHQCLCIHFGGGLERLSVVKHGQRSLLVDVDETDPYSLFTPSHPIRNVTRYHSLHVVHLEDCNDLKVLSYAVDENGSTITRVVMGARHTSKPFWGVQYHPESICTSEGGGIHVIANFWRHAETWNRAHNRLCFPPLPKEWRNQFLRSASHFLAPLPNAHPEVNSGVMEYISTSCPALCGMKTLGSSDTLILDSSASPGRFSIIGASTTTMERITHLVGNKVVEVWKGMGQPQHVVLGNMSIWQFLAIYLGARKPPSLPANVETPFWGGLIGYASYESGVDTLGIPIAARRFPHHPDVQFAFVERSVVIDHERREIRVQSISRDVDAEARWIEKARSLLEVVTSSFFTPAPSPYPRTPSPLEWRSQFVKQGTPHLSVNLPDKKTYLHRIAAAQDYLAAGDSYELCVTALTRVDVTLPSTSPCLINDPTLTKSSAVAWPLFKALRALNPAPYGAFIRLGETTLVGSSPERFLSWTRDGRCQMRPIKGTVRKAKPGNDGGQVTLEEAKQLLLGSSKELAENLMIVDLVRHDMSRIVSAPTSSRDRKSIRPEDEVQVTKLFQVEEYETVYQLVSVIEGRVDTSEGYTGWDVLSGSLPPGSMTGAPKKRSVELLQVLESMPRGVYSGVCGYWCVGGGGDFSVIIRSAFRYDGDNLPNTTSVASDAHRETWYVGAGGAITALSDPLGEWEEMRTKLEGTLGAFRN
ncbi:ADC synthase, partial [Cantharellus anzutake]|uniref:ADC synthase n=1 Tax=Cantharellus anzutake TaxID=1750568 RepID=UPI0019069199